MRVSFAMPIYNSKKKKKKNVVMTIGGLRGEGGEGAPQGSHAGINYACGPRRRSGAMVEWHSAEGWLCNVTCVGGHGCAQYTRGGHCDGYCRA